MMQMPDTQQNALEALSQVSRLLLADWARAAATQPQGGQITISHEFMLGKVKAEMTFTVLETDVGN